MNKKLSRSLPRLLMACLISLMCVSLVGAAAVKGPAPLIQLLSSTCLIRSEFGWNNSSKTLKR